MGVVLSPAAREASAQLLSNTIWDDDESFFTALRSAEGGGQWEDALWNKVNVCEAWNKFSEERYNIFIRRQAGVCSEENACRWQTTAEIKAQRNRPRRLRLLLHQSPPQQSSYSCCTLGKARTFWSKILAEVRDRTSSLPLTLLGV